MSDMTDNETPVMQMLEEVARDMGHAWGTAETEAPVVNIPLLRKAVEWAEAEAARGDDSEWDQQYWRNVGGKYGGQKKCGTTYCIAGWTCYAAGEKWASPTMESTLEGELSVSERAQELLGLDWWQAEDLFDGNNGIEAVRTIAEEIAGERL